MSAKVGEEPPPQSTDLAAWQRVVTDGRHVQFPLEAIVAAIQDLGPNTDKTVRNALAKCLSDRVYSILRRNVGRNHPNEGQDIIDRVHFQLFVALARTKSADGKAMRIACVARTLYRLKDAIAKEARDRRVPAESRANSSKKSKAAGKTKDTDGEEVKFDGIEEHPDVAEEVERLDHEDASLSRFKHDPSLMDGVRDLDQQIDVDRFLEENISDDRKRLAFRLFMDDIPYKSKKSNSIAEALGIDEKTARQWIQEVQVQLRQKVGEKT